MTGEESIHFKKNKFINIKIINKGGWHFTEISAEEIFEKHKNDDIMTNLS